MLIVPIQAQPGPARAPLATLALIALNVLVFLFYQGGDARIAERALEQYQHAQLLPREQPLYRQYLDQHDSAQAAQLQLDAEDWGAEVWTAYILHDRGFDHYLREYWQQAPELPEAALAEWQAQRQSFEQTRNRLSVLAGGLIPAEARPWTFITSTFLHGDWGHLLGNMVFLLLFGCALERALGVLPYLGLYLVCGAAGDLLYTLFNSHSYIPLVGASGAISGLMGMYVSLYRLRRIRFFYAVLFYFGEFRAPALLILPLWLGKELAGQLFSDTNIAYLAHAGGMLAGAGLMLLARRSHAHFTELETTQSQHEALKAGMVQVQQAMNRLDYPRARALARNLCAQHPDNPWPWRTAVDISRLQPRQPAFAQDVNGLLDSALAPGADFSRWADDVTEVLALYQQAVPPAPPLSGAHHLALAQRFWDIGRHQLAETHLRQARADMADHPQFTACVRRCAAFYGERGQHQQANRLLALAAPAAAGSVVSAMPSREE